MTDLENLVDPTAEPLVNFASNDLTKDVKDDWLIATAISSKTTLTEDEFLVIVTGDLGLKMKGAPRGICTLTLPSKYRLPDEDDPAEKKIKDLENQVRQLSARLPILSLRFENEVNNLEVELTRPEPLEPLIAKKIAELRGEHPKLTAERGEQGLSVSGALDVLVPSQVAKYNSELEQFFNDYARFLSDAGPVLDRLKRCVKVALKLVNEGTAPAADVDIDIYIPDGVLVFGDDDQKPVPEVPKPPLRPTTIRESLASFKGFSASEYIASQMRPSFAAIIIAHLTTSIFKTPYGAGLHKIAIVGGGIAGPYCAWELLKEHHVTNFFLGGSVYPPGLNL